MSSNYSGPQGPQMRNIPTASITEPAEQELTIAGFKESQIKAFLDEPVFKAFEGKIDSFSYRQTGEEILVYAGGNQLKINGKRYPLNKLALIAATEKYLDQRNTQRRQRVEQYQEQVNLKVENLKKTYNLQSISGCKIQGNSVVITGFDSTQNKTQSHKLDITNSPNRNIYYAIAAKFARGEKEL
jgi:hypothetical protein